MNALTKKEQAYVQYELYKTDPILWGKMFLQKHFPLKSAAFQVEMLDLSVTERYLAVASPRESSKSTLLALVYPLHSITFRTKRFILLISNTFKKAAMSLESIKKEINTNEMLIKCFGKIEIIKDAEGDSVLRNGNFETKFLCKGVDQIGSVRGVKFGECRPDLIIGDDLEDDELVKNPVRRSELRDEFDEALIPAGDRSVCQYIMIGTILHYDSLMAKLVSKELYKEYTKLFYQARTNGHSIWPQKWTDEYLDELEKIKPSVFAKEYQNDPVTGRNVRFKKEDFRYYEVENGKYLCFEKDRIISSGSFSECKAAISCDLAWSEKRTADASVLMPAFLTPENFILVDSYISKIGMKPEEFCEQLFVMEERLKKLTGMVVEVGLEKAMLENVTKYILEKRMRNENRYILIKELKWDADKETRIVTRLEPRYAQHVIFHRQGMGDLEHQLERFPSAVHDDLADALQGAVQLLQYPKHRKPEVPDEDQFMRIRKFLIDSRIGRVHTFSGSKFKEIVQSTTAWI